MTPCFFFFSSSSFLFSFFSLLSLFPFNFPRLLLSPSPSRRTFSRTAAFFLPAQLCPRPSPCPFRPLPLPLSLLLFSFIFFSCIAVHFHFLSCSVSSTAWCLSSFLILSLFSFLSYSREVLAQGDPSTWSGLLFGVFIFFSLYYFYFPLNYLSRLVPGTTDLRFDSIKKRGSRWLSSSNPRRASNSKTPRSLPLREMSIPQKAHRRQQLRPSMGPRSVIATCRRPQLPAAVIIIP